MTVQEVKESIEYLKMQLTEDLEMICFTGDELKALDMSIQALEEVEQYRALGTVEELKEAKKLLEKLEELKFANEQSKTDWIPFEQREADEEEKEYWLENYGQEIEYMLCGRLPDEDEEIIVSYSNGCVGEDIFLRDGVDCYLDSGAEFITETIAWMPKPQPYKKEGAEND